METLQHDLVVDVDGGAMTAALVRPAEGQHLAGVIVIHDILGLTAHTRDVAARFAREGYVALAPDLFWNLGPLPQFTDRESFMNFRRSLDDPSILRSIDEAVATLRAEPDVNVAKIGIVGFCMGGYYAFLEACTNASLAACIDFYGAPLTIPHTSERSPRTSLEAARDLRVPTEFLFGAADESIPLDHIELLRAELQNTGTPFEIQIYPGAEHAFFNDTRPDVYRADAAQDAWQRTLTHFRRYLQTV